MMNLFHQIFIIIVIIINIFILTLDSHHMVQVTEFRLDLKHEHRSKKTAWNLIFSDKNQTLFICGNIGCELDHCLCLSSKQTDWNSLAILD